MRRVLVFLASVSLILVLLVGLGGYLIERDLRDGGDLDPTAISASFQIRREPSIRLKPDAAPLLSAWLTQHGKAWGKVFYTPPLTDDGWITLIYQDGRSVSLELFPGSIIAYRGNNEGMIDKGMPPADIAELRALFQAE